MKRIHFIVCALLSLLWLGGRSALSAKTYLVAVGIADYPGTQNDLHLPAHDAEVMAWLYQKNGKAETVLLKNTEATLANVEAAMAQEFAKAQADDAVILFFSGHGSPGSFVCYDGFLKYEVVRNEMAKSAAHHKMIFADACFSGKMREGGHATQQPTNSSYADLDVLLFLSSRTDETSIETPSMKNGFFTAYLQRGLRGGADTDKDRIITAKELFTFVSQGVNKLSQNRQHPVMWGKFDNTMPVISWK